MQRAAMDRTRRILYWMLPALFCVWYYRRTIRIWFSADDFAWLGLGLSVFDFHSFLQALFGPQAQGTVRFLSERGFFMTFQALFGVDPIPFRLWVALTVCVNLVLLAATTRRLTGSHTAGFLAPIFWTLNSGLAVAICWISSYNQILCSTFLLAGFLFFLRHVESGSRVQLAGAWAMFLLGFGALEIMVMFPVLLAAWCLAFARGQLRRTIPFFAASAGYLSVHLAFIPKIATDPNYQMHFDAALARTLWTYWQWALGPSRLHKNYAAPMWIEITGTAILTLAVAAFLLREIRARRWQAALFLGWFLALIAPVLPLRDHVSDYYLASASMGLAMLLAWGVVAAAQWRPLWRTAALLAVAVYVAGSAAQSRFTIEWYRDSTRPVRVLVEGVVRARELHPDKVILLEQVSSTLFWAGVFDNPFRLYRIRGVYLTPGSEQRIVAHPEWGNVADFVLAPGVVRRALERDGAVVYEVGRERLRNVTSDYSRAHLARLKDELPATIDASDPVFADLLGSGWYAAEGGSRWMSRRATARVRAPTAAGQKLHVSAFCPRELLAGGPARLTVSAAGTALGSYELGGAGVTFEARFDLPISLIGKEAVELTLEVSRSFVPASDQRELTIAFGTLAIR